MRELSKLSGGVDALAENDLVQKECTGPKCSPFSWISGSPRTSCWAPLSKHSAVDVKVKTVHVALHDEPVRQLKTRVHGGNAYTPFAP